MKRLDGKVALVAGATRGAGRGIATALGELGATVYCTGLRVPGTSGMTGRTETIQQTAEIVTARGGRGIAIQVDHTVPDQVARLVDEIWTRENEPEVAARWKKLDDTFVRGGPPPYELPPSE